MHNVHTRIMKLFPSFSIVSGVVRPGQEERRRDVRLHPQLPLGLLLGGRQRGHGVHQAPQRNHW